MCVLRGNAMNKSEGCGFKPHEEHSIANISQESSPRSVGDEGFVTDDQTCLKFDEQRPGRVKLLCSYGGKIYPRPHDSQLRYVGGETKVLVVSRNISLAKLMEKVIKLAGKDVLIKYQLPYEDLDALVSVLSDEDVQNMLEEFEKAQSRNSSCRLHLFLFANKRQKYASQLYDVSKCSGQQFADKMHGKAVISKKYQASSQDSPPVIQDIPFHLDNTRDAASKHSNKPFTGGVQRIGLPVANYSSFTPFSSSTSASVHTPQKEAAKFYKPPVERMQSFRGHATAQESPFSVTSPRSLKSSTAPISGLLQSSDLKSFGLNCSTVSSPFSQMDLLEHSYACSSPLVGVQDSGRLPTKPSTYSDTRINHGRDAKFLADPSGVSNLPSYFIPPKQYPGLHPEYQHSDVPQTDNTSREKYDFIYDRPLQNSDPQKDKGRISNKRDKTYISEESSGLLCPLLDSGDLATSAFQDRSQRPQHLLSHSTFNSAGKTYLRNHIQQPQIKQSDFTSVGCSIPNTEMTLKAMATHDSGIRGAYRPPMASKQKTLQTATTEDVSSSRQVRQPSHFFPQFLPEATTSGRLSRTSFYLNKDHTTPTNLLDHHLQAEDRFTVHDSPFIDIKTQAGNNKDSTSVYAPHSVLCAGNNVNQSLWHGFRCNPDVLCDCNNIQATMETRRHGIYHKVRG